MSNRYPHCDHFASYTVCTLKIIKINSFKRVQHDLLHGKWEVILNAISTDDTQWNCFPKYDLVIIELKCVVVLRPMCKYSRHHCWSGHENGNRFPRWPVNICWVISQLIDQPAEKQRERERGAGVPGQSQKTSNQKPRPTPPEHKLNDAQPLTDNKTT